MGEMLSTCIQTLVTTHEKRKRKRDVYATLSCVYLLQSMDSSPLTAKGCFVGLKNSTWYEIVLSAVIEKNIVRNEVSSGLFSPSFFFFLCQNNQININ